MSFNQFLESSELFKEAVNLVYCIYFWYIELKLKYICLTHNVWSYNKTRDRLYANFYCTAPYCKSRRNIVCSVCVLLNWAVEALPLTQSDRWPAGRSHLRSHLASPTYDTSAQPASTHSSEYTGQKEGTNEKEISKWGSERTNNRDMQ